MMFAVTVLCLSLLFSLVQAVPLVARDVFNPTITSPTASTVWPVGTTQVVSWETDNIPPDSQITNPKGMVVLGHLGPTGGLNLDLDHPLAQNFSYHVGSVQITVPNVPPRSDYIVVLFGDSGNASPAFAITQITNGGSTSAAPTPSASASETPSGNIPAPASHSTPDTSPTPSSTPYVNTVSTPDLLTSSVSAALGQLTAATSSAHPVTTTTTTTTTTTSSAWARYSFSWTRTLSSVCAATMSVAFLI